MAEAVLVTEAFLDSGRSRKGAWTRKQLAIVGVQWPPLPGWKRELLRSGKTLTEKEAARFVKLAGK